MIYLRFIYTQKPNYYVIFNQQLLTVKPIDISDVSNQQFLTYPWNYVRYVLTQTRIERKQQIKRTKNKNNHRNSEFS